MPKNFKKKISRNLSATSCTTLLNVHKNINLKTKKLKIMKRVSFFAVILTITFTSCSLMDNSLISDIISASKTEITADELPNSALEVLNTDYFGTYIDEVLEAKGLGFEVSLSDESKVYFDEEGGCLNGTEKGGKKGKKGHKKGRGEAIDIASLSTTITDYISTNYPDATIDGARTHPEKGFMVKLSTDIIVLFDLDGNFIDEHEFTYHHGNRNKIEIADLSTLITDYISTHYPDATIKVAFEKGESIMVGIEENGDKKMLVFDSESNFIEEKTCND